MAKGKSPIGNQGKGRIPPLDQRDQGLRWYQMGRLDAAITAWQPLAATDPQVAKGLAEVHFRRALTQTTSATDKVTDLRRAVELGPADNRYSYHLGMTLHRAGDLQGAIQQYRTVLGRDKQWPGAAQLLALATLELDPQADLTSLPGMHQEWLTALAPVQALLRGKQPTTQGDEPDQQLWRGLGLLLQKEAKAGKVLDDNRPLPSAGAIAIRRYYRGVAAAQSGDLQAALHTWQHVGVERFTQPWLRINLAAALQQRLEAQLTVDDLASAADSALLGVPFATGNSGLAELLVHTLDQGAYAAAEAGDWTRAAELWTGARQVISNSTGLGSPRPILHNLALAYEGSDQWLEAAETWRAMLRTRPRKTGSGNEQPNTTGLSDTQWGWVRRRVIECYKRADAPGEAVTVFRQAIKSEPNDLDLRFELSEALLANDQEQAALNELQRILDIDPQHVDAMLRIAEIRSERGEWWDSERILRQLVADYPDREDVRKQLAQQLLTRGARDMAWSLDEATKLIEEGQSLAPDDFRFPLNLARIAIALKQRPRIAEFLSRTLELGTDQPQVYVLVIESWALADDLGEARGVLDRAERELTITPEFYVDLGRALMLRSRPAPAYTNPFLPPPPKAVDNDVSRFAGEVFERAIAGKPDDSRLRGQIAAALMTIRPDIALQHAEAGARLAPDQPAAVMLFGLAQALNEQKKQAKATLKRAIQLAKAQNQPEIAAQAEAMLQQVGSPFLRMSLEMAEMGLDEFDELDDLDDDDLWP